MIPNVVRGRDFHALLRYLVGPGRAGEHRSARLVAGSWPFWGGIDSGEVLTAADVRDIARPLGDAGRVWDEFPRGGPVWHCQLFRSPGAAPLDDRRWRDLAHVFMAEMAFDDSSFHLADGSRDALAWLMTSPIGIDAARFVLTGKETVEPCDWVAVRHGLTKTGQDHVHIVSGVVRPDGSRVNLFRDWPRAQTAARAALFAVTAC